MSDEQRGVPIKVKVMDKRRSHAAVDDAATPSVTDQASMETASEEASTKVSRSEGSPDFRRRDEEVGSGDAPSSAAPEADVVGEGSGASAEAEARDYLDDLRRLQAEFDNYRKRMMKEQTAMGARATARLIERLLPVLDNFDRALQHGNDDTGVELVYKELRAALEAEGLSEIEAEGRPFDPMVHEAVESVEEPDLVEPVVRTVYRRGYRLGDQVLRAAMVGVARPVEETSAAPAADADAGAGDPVEDELSAPEG